jgi:hypothetical protein
MKPPWRSTAVALNISAATVRRIINEGLLPASQLCKGAPCVIRTDDLAHADIGRAVARIFVSKLIQEYSYRR